MKAMFTFIVLEIFFLRIARCYDPQSEPQGVKGLIDFIKVELSLPKKTDPIFSMITI